MIFIWCSDFIKKQSAGGELSKLWYVETREHRANITNECVDLHLFRGKSHYNIVKWKKVTENYIWNDLIHVNCGISAFVYVHKRLERMFSELSQAVISM